MRWVASVRATHGPGSMAANVGRLGLVLVLSLGGVFSSIEARAQTPTEDGVDTLRTWCSGCHTEERPGYFQRISSIRKSPEGWLMTLVRMQQAHGVDVPTDVRDSIMAHLSNSQGLAPSESAAARFALERRPNAQDLKLGDDLPTMCGRCHTLARVALQRRDATEWNRLVHTHVGQYPTLEYQAGARERDWWEIATKELPEKLANQYGFESKDWQQWQSKTPADLSGTWVVAGRVPGEGGFFGTMKVARTDSMRYTADYKLVDTSGAARPERQTKVRVYTGYEWRGSGTEGARSLREVYAASADGTKLEGRFFDATHIEIGGDLAAFRAEGPPAIVAVMPRALKVGVTQTVVIVGRNLSGTPNFGPAARVKVIDRGTHFVRAAVTFDRNATIGERPIRWGAAKADGMVVVYDRVDRISVSPSYGIARVGGGKVPPVSAQYEAIGYLERAGGAPLSLGPIDVSWQVEPFNADAVAADDVKFAGIMAPNGRFSPAPAGPNPNRKFSSNNAGDLAVKARLSQDGSVIEGSGRLVVTMQRWVNPPIY